MTVIVAVPSATPITVTAVANSVVPSSALEMLTIARSDVAALRVSASPSGSLNTPHGEISRLGERLASVAVQGLRVCTDQSVLAHHLHACSYGRSHDLTAESGIMADSAGSARRNAIEGGSAVMSRSSETWMNLQHRRPIPHRPVPTPWPDRAR